MPAAVGAVTFDKASGGAVSFAHTCPAVANVVLYVIIMGRFASGITGVTYNGIAMVQQAFNPGANVVDIKVFRLVIGVGDGLSHNVVLAPVGAVPNRVAVTAISVTGADQTNPNGTILNTSGGPGASISDTVVAAANQLVIDAAAIQEDTAAASALTVGAGQTQRSNQEQVSTGFGLVGAVSTEPGAASVPMSWTIGGAQAVWAHTAFAVNDASGDSTPPGNALVTANEAPAGAQINLTITMPADGDLSQFEVRRLTGAFPNTTRTDGTVIVAPTATTPLAQVNIADASGLVNGQRYNYRVFCKDVSGNWNTGSTVSEVAATVMTVVGWYTAGGTLAPTGDAGANPIFEWTVDTADVEAAKPVMFRVAVGSDNPTAYTEPAFDVQEFFSGDAAEFAAGSFKYFTGGNWATIPQAGVPWAAVNAGPVTCRYYSQLNATQDLYGVVRPEQA